MPDSRQPRRQPRQSLFRRSKPKTDSQRTVYSYYNTHSARSDSLASNRQPGKKKGWRPPGVDHRQWLRNLPALVALVALIFCLLYCLGLSNTPQVIVPPGASGNLLRSKQTYQAGAQAILAKSLLNHTKLTVNVSSFKKQFLKQYPEVADVSLSLPLISQQPILTLVEAPPALLWQAQNQPLTVLDQNGRVIMAASSLSAATRAKLPAITDQSGLNPKPGSTVLAATNVSYIQTVLGQLAAKNLKVTSITLLPQSQEMDVRIAGLPYYIKFDFTTDAREAVGTFLAIKQYIDSQHITPSSYVDVRISGRAYYK